MDDTDSRHRERPAPDGQDAAGPHEPAHPVRAVPRHQPEDAEDHPQGTSLSGSSLSRKEEDICALK